MNMKLLSIFTATLMACIVAAGSHAEPYSFRNANVYDLGGGPMSTAYVTVWTDPIQAFQPVYAWRNHVGGAGDYGYASNGELVGYTDESGVWYVALDLADVPMDACGEYQNERYAVGSRSGPQTAPNSFYIQNTGLMVSPAPPGCRR